MRVHVRFAVLILCVALTACAGGQTKTANPAAASKPPAEYLYIGGASTTPVGNSISVETNMPEMDNERDSRLSIAFGFHFMSAEMDARSAELPTTGTGRSVTDPIRLSSIGDADDQVDAALNHLAKLAPQRKNVVGRLYKSPDGLYLMLVSYETSSGRSALYFDVTEWAIKAVDY